MRNNEIEIRRAKPSDIEKLDYLLFQVHKVHSDARPDLFVSGAKKYTDEQLRQILKDETKPIFVAVQNGTVFGYAFCVIINNGNEPSHTDIKTLYIDDLCVDETCRGKGIGKLLYNFVVGYAKQCGCYNVTLNVWADNKNAVAFYEKIGMHIQKIGMEKIL
ncbi:MAG: GNAT family N-acetyltransferase [Clostridia bacterium]|nr:GNAT family N-acetyltransferase [Clostridia bacterium]